MRSFQPAWCLLRRLVGSYIGLAVLPLVVIVVSMSAIASSQANQILFRFMQYPGTTFEVLDNADYSGRREVRSSVVRFEGGVAGPVREAITTFGGAVSAVSRRIVEEAKREEAARAAASSNSAFALSADSQRAASARPLSGASLQSAIDGRPDTSPASAGLSPGAVSVALVTPAPLASRPPATPPTTSTPALGVATISTSTPAALAPANTPAPRPAVNAPTTTPEPPAAPATPPANGGQVLPTATPAPLSTTVVTPTFAAAATTPSPQATLAPTQTNLPSVTAVPPSPTARETATTAPPTTTPVARTATPEPRSVVGDTVATATATPVPTSTPLPTSTALPTATVPEMALDLSVPGGSSLSLQPVFSGDLKMRAGESTVRTVNVQNNGTRAFRYYLNTSGGSGPLWSDTANGLQMSVVRNGTEVYRGSLSMPDQLIGQLSRGGQDSLVITVWLPSTADNRFQGLSTTIAYNFTAVAASTGP